LINISDNPDLSDGVAEYFFEGSDGQQALTEDAPETKMIIGVTGEFIPGN